MAKSRFTDEQKATIRKLHDEDKLPYAAIAAMFDVSPITINRICRPDLAARQAEASKQNRARNAKKYAEVQRKNYRSYTLKFHNTNDKPVIDQLDKQDSMSDYIRQLILDDLDEGSSS